MEVQYQHTCLRSLRSIRVIHLRPSSAKESPLICDLKEVSLDDLPQYHALSYSWDSQVASCPIHCGPGILQITPNCVAALRQLRHQSDDQVLWIDSICIDQSSIEERGRQVGLMGEIYKLAQRVVVWLGEGDDTSTKAMQSLMDVGNIGSDTDLERRQRSMAIVFGLDIKNQSEDPVGPLFTRSWFSRMWTIQEVTLASVERVIVYCGEQTLPWFFLVTALGYLESAKYRWGNWHEAMQLQTVLSKQLMGRRHPFDVEESENLQRSINMLQILTLAREKVSTDPKDKVFALFGVFHELKLTIPQPDYRCSLEQVYAEAAISCIEHDESLQVLFHAPSDHRRPELPSWVPDWSDIGWRDPDPRSGSIRSAFSAAGTSKPEWSYSGDYFTLSVKGKVIDSITSVGDKMNIETNADSGIQDNLIINARDIIGNTNWKFKALLDTMETASAVFKNWVNISSEFQVYPNHEAVKFALKRTLVEDEPAKSETDESFEAWYQLMTSPSPVSDTTSAEQRNFQSFLSLQLSTGSASRYHLRALAHSAKKRFFMTSNGFFGTAADIINGGDLVATVAGLDMPVILRSTEDGYLFVAHAYVHGIMGGEAWSNQNYQCEKLVLI